MLVFGLPRKIVMRIPAHVAPEEGVVADLNYKSVSIVK